MENRLFQQVIYSAATLGAVVILASGCVAQGTATKTSAAPQGAATAQYHPAMLDPTQANEKAPEKFQVQFETTKGDFVIEVNREWAPNGADRFYNMVRIGYFKDIAIFRAIKGFMFQFGIHGDPAVSSKWSDASIKDDPSVNISNQKGYITFAQTQAANSRSTQMFLNLGNNASLDASRNGSTPFVPFGKIISGMDVLEKIYSDYGENSREVQGKFKQEGNAFIKKKYPNIDYVKSVKLVSAQGS